MESGGDYAMSSLEVEIFPKVHEDIMKIGIPKERQGNEARVAISPDTIKKLRSQNIDILILN